VTVNHAFERGELAADVGDVELGHVLTSGRLLIGASVYRRRA
jgi:hypothetical protein